MFGHKETYEETAGKKHIDKGFDSIFFSQNYKKKSQVINMFSRNVIFHNTHP